ncbi:MAG: methylenetetrahydrofolate--tRNA-(uracil(54)-C(5))-methyltransferase (FADH(2)-oxidizing) TrmFO [Phototrophicaceae bacterium]
MEINRANLHDAVVVIGGGLAGSEAAWQLAQRGFKVRLYEMRPHRQTGAHLSDRLGELVCSNSLGSLLPDRATGVLQSEMQKLGSLLIDIAYQVQVPAGGALAVDRDLFSKQITDTLASHPNIEIIRQELTSIPDAPCIIATGPLTSPSLSIELAKLTGQDYLYFYDALAPIVSYESINMEIAFRANRYGHGDDETSLGDYINCPMDKQQYSQFVEALRTAETATLRDFEQEEARFFEGCMPIEQIAKRGTEALAFGPMRPVGISYPNTTKRPYAVVQLRQDNVAGTLYNLVGFQTNIRYGKQQEILQMIPGLEQAEFVRFGQMHRNTFINSPTLLNESLQFKSRADLYFAGQITGVEGYAGNIATGLFAGINLARFLSNEEPLILPRSTMLGALCHYITHCEPSHFQPMKANFGIIPEPDQPIRNKRQRYSYYAERSARILTDFLEVAHQHPIPNQPITVDSLKRE